MCEQNQESLIEALQSQITFYKGEHENIKGETKTLIQENSDLSKQLEIVMKKNSEIQSVLSSRYNDIEIIENLKKKLHLFEKERNSFESLWKTSQNMIRNLENEMKVYQSIKKFTYPHEDTDEIKFEYASIIKMLESKVTNTTEELKSKEELFKTLLEEKDNIKSQLLERNENIKILSDQLTESNIKIENLQKETLNLRNELLLNKQTTEDVLKQFENCKNNFDILSKKEFEARKKVAEALQLVEMATNERDILIEKENLANDASTRLTSQITEVLNESTLRIQKETDIIKQNYNNKLNDMLIHIQRLELEVTEKNYSLEKAMKENSSLKDKMHNDEKCRVNIHEEKSNKLLSLENKLETAFQQLILMECQNIKLTSEKESIQTDLSQLKNSIQIYKKQREWEEKLHKNEIHSLRVQIHNLKDALNRAHKTVQKLQLNRVFEEKLENGMIIDSNEIDTQLQNSTEKELHDGSTHKLKINFKRLELETKIKEITEQLRKLNSIRSDEKICVLKKD